MSTLVKLQARSFRLSPSAPWHRAAADRHARSDPVARPRSVERAEADGNRPGVDGGRGRRRRSSARARRARATTSRSSAPASSRSPTSAISVKDSPQNTLIWVTRLDNAAPRARGARLDRPAGRQGDVDRHDRRRRRRDRAADAAARSAQLVRVRVPRHGGEGRRRRLRRQRLERRHPAVGIRIAASISTKPIRCCAERSSPIAASTSSGEEVHFKAVLRSNTPAGVRLLPEGTAVSIAVRDARDKVVDERIGQGERLEHGGVDADACRPKARSATTACARSSRAIARNRSRTARPAGRVRRGQREWKKTVSGGFLVAAYRRPDFRVDVTLTGDVAHRRRSADGVVTARYLFGAPMGKRPTHWTFTRTPVFSAPSSITETFPAERWTFVGWAELGHPARPDRDGSRTTRTLTATGQLRADARDRGQGRRALRLHARRGRRGRVAAAHRQPREPRRPSRAVVHRHQAAAAVQRAARRTEDRARRRRARRQARAGRHDRREADAGAVAERAARRRQRFLWVGDRAEGSARGRVEADQRARRRSRSTCDAAGGRHVHPRSARRTPGRSASP